MLPERIRPASIYVVYVPRRDQISILESADCGRIQQLFSVGQVTAVLSALNHEVLDQALNQFSLDRVFMHVHKRSLSSFQKVWVVGSGSSVYAREVIRAATSKNRRIPVIDYTPQGSCLGRYIKMMQDGIYRQSYFLGESRGFMIPG